jgi:hypothetical protein
MHSASTTAAVDGPTPAKQARLIEPPAPTILNFDHCSDAVCAIVNEEPGGRKDFKKTYGVPYRKCDAIEEIIDHGIRAKVSQQSVFEAKIHALYELTQIGLIIMGATPSQFAKETGNGQVPRKIRMLWLRS